MRYRYVFITGLGAGFVLGARAGRERYDQLVRLVRSVADNPSVQQAAGAAQAQAAGLVRSVRDTLADRVPGMAATARGKMAEARHGHFPGSRSRSAYGHPESDGHGRYQTTPGSHGGPRPE